MRANKLEDIFKFVQVKENSPNSCWLWIGSKRGYGYGVFSMKQKTYQAHRVMYEIACGKIPEGKELHHICENQPCVNPCHLRPVTHRENMLIGENLSARNMRKTHCPLGHELKHPNLVKRKNSSRQCKACYRVYWKKRKEFKNGK